MAENAFAGQEMVAREAALKLDNALCHQHIMVADAALPAYDHFAVLSKDN